MNRSQARSSLNADLSMKLKKAVSSGDTTAVRRLLKGGVECSATYWVSKELTVAHIVKWYSWQCVQQLKIVVFYSIFAFANRFIRKFVIYLTSFVSPTSPNQPSTGCPDYLHFTFLHQDDTCPSSSTIGVLFWTVCKKEANDDYVITDIVTEQATEYRYCST